MIDAFSWNDVQFDEAFGLTHLSIAVVQQMCTIGEWPVFQRNSGHRTINQYSNFLNESSPNYNFILLPTGPDFDSWILSCWKCTFMNIAALQSVLFSLFPITGRLCVNVRFFSSLSSDSTLEKRPSSHRSCDAEVLTSVSLIYPTRTQCQLIDFKLYKLNMASKKVHSFFFRHSFYANGKCESFFFLSSFVSWSDNTFCISIYATHIG